MGVPMPIVLSSRALPAILAVGVLTAASAAPPARADGPAQQRHPRAIPAEIYAQPFSWQGLYFGASLGYGRGHSTHTYDRNDNHGAATQDLAGFAGSLTAGYNWMLTPSFLFGVEGDLGFMDLNASDKTIFDGHIWKSQFGPLWGTMRARAGVTWGQTLVYGTGGLAFMGVDEIGYGDAAGQTAWNRSFRTGWALGAGVEYAISSRMTAKIEYLHMDFGSYAGLSENRENYTFENTANLVRAGLNFKF